MVMKQVVPSHKHTNALIKQGYEVVVGIDEVGRGCLAGPVVAAAVILHPKTKLPGVRDSKVLTRTQREEISVLIKQKALSVGIGWVHSWEVDQKGLTWAVRQSGIRALMHMNTEYHAVILDGKHNYLKEHCFAQVIVGADAKCLNVASASIVAKVARDNYMRRMHLIYPEFGFDFHVGYGTRAHLEAIQQGLSPLHRRLFAPVQSALQTQLHLSS